LVYLVQLLLVLVLVLVLVLLPVQAQDEPPTACPLLQHPLGMMMLMRPVQTL